MSEPTYDLHTEVASALFDVLDGEYGTCLELASAAIRAYEAHRPRPVVVLSREEWRTALFEAAAKMAGDEWGYPLDRPRFLYDAHAAISAAFPWIKVEGD